MITLLTTFKICTFSPAIAGYIYTVIYSTDPTTYLVLNNFNGSDSKELSITAIKTRPYHIPQPFDLKEISGKLTICDDRNVEEKFKCGENTQMNRILLGSMTLHMLHKRFLKFSL